MQQLSRRQADAFRNTGPMTDPPYQLSDDQWNLIADLFPDPPMTRKGGRPFKANRACFEGILWVLQTGARWKDLPRCFPSKSVCHSRFQEWVKDGRLVKAWMKLVAHVKALGRLDLSTLIGDGTFAPSKKGVAA